MAPSTDVLDSLGKLLDCMGDQPIWVSAGVWQSSCSECKAQIELFNNPTKYPFGVYLLPKHLDEKVARLQLKKLNAQLSELTDAHARYIVVDKADHYRY